MSSGSAVATLANPIDEPLSSGFLSTSVSSLSAFPSSRHGSSQFSKTFRQASSLFLTRRLQEALSALQPLVTNTPAPGQTNGDSPEGAPIAGASRSLRVKVWSLYLTILDAVVNLGPDEGKNIFGSQEWRSLVGKTREGKVWDEVVIDGYRGVEGDVDPEVIISLSMLLLEHSPSQTLTQQRLENYLSASAAPNLDISSRLQTNDFSDQISEPRRRRPSPNGGTDTPRDLNTRIRILELYALHVLSRNEEWDYAREFISLSEVLDEEKREAFLQTLQMLQDERDRASQLEADFQREQDAQQERERQDSIERQAEDAAAEKSKAEREQKIETSTSRHKRTSSEVDYGIESSNPSGSTASLSKPGTTKEGSNPRALQPSSTRLSPPPRLPKSAKASASTSSGLFKRASLMISSLQKLLLSIARSTSMNSMTLIRTLLLLVGLILVLSRSPVRERVRKIVGVSWEKIAGTVGMGVKVSYM